MALSFIHSDMIWCRLVTGKIGSDIQGSKTFTFNQAQNPLSTGFQTPEFKD